MAWNGFNTDLEAQPHTRGDYMDHTPVGAVAAGTVLDVGGVHGVAVDAIAAGKLGAVQIAGIIIVAKASATVFAAGAEIEWDDTAKLAVAAAGGDFNLGRCVEIDGEAGVNGNTWVGVLLIQDALA